MNLHDAKKDGLRYLMTMNDITQQIEEMKEICSVQGRVSIMEVCGTHTVALFRTGIRSLLPDGIRLISGPGCPVCVTAQGFIDAACSLAGIPDIVICTYGDMVRVPGTNGSLAEKRAGGGRVNVVYSSRDALAFAMKNPDRKVVFIAVGFETTAPSTAAVILEAVERNVNNFYLLIAHKLVIPAMKAVLSSKEVQIDGFLCPGHVSVVIGAKAYEIIAKDYHKPCVIAGFEPALMLDGILNIVRQKAKGESRVENLYGAVVSDEGNAVAQQIVESVFETAPAVWRAMGTIERSGLKLREKYRRFDASELFNLDLDTDTEIEGCRCGEVIQGIVDPVECALFASRCNPSNPVGPCMVSSEGTCSAWYKYGTAGHSKGRK